MTIPDAAKTEQLNLNDLVIFSRVVQQGSFTAAARHLGKTPSYVSKHVTQLEDALSLTLVYRSTHQVQLTEAGRIFFDHCLRVLAEIDAAKANAAGMSDQIAGVLRVHSTPGVGQGLVAPALLDLTRSHPLISVDLSISAYSASLMERGVDIVVGSRSFDDDETFHAGLFERNLGPAPYVLCASPAYLARRGRPQSPDNLKDHDCLVHLTQKHDPRTWRFRQSGQEVEIAVAGRLQSNLEGAILLAVRGGDGIARLPYYSVVQDICEGRLVTLFDGEVMSDRNIKAFYPRVRFVPAKTRAFIQALDRRLRL